MSKLLENTFASALGVALNFALIVGSLFAAGFIGDLLAITYAQQYACAAWALYWFYTTVERAAEFSAFDHSMPPIDMIANGVGGLVFCALLTVQPAHYPQLAAIPWPIPDTLGGFILPNTPGYVYYVEWLSLMGLGFVPLMYGLALTAVGTLILILIAAGRLDASQFEAPIRDDQPSYYELVQNIHALNKALSDAEGARETAEATSANLRRERDTLARDEQAIRQELVRSATQLSVLQRESAQVQSDLRSERETNKTLQASLLDLETVVTDLRSRIHAQGSKQPKTTQEQGQSNAANALADIIDPEVKP